MHQGKRVKDRNGFEERRNGNGREKGNVDGVRGDGVDTRGTVKDVILRSREMAMERHLTLVLIQSWDRWRKAFRIAGRRVRFMVFDVVLLTGLPAIGQKVELDREEVLMEVGNMVRACMAEWEWQEIAKRIPGKSGEKRRFFRHHVNVMMELCEENAEEERIWI
ncbi:hypothetical protein Cgig2_000007 [Carnegiea gigantea]|uniref:Uncharacterized protein n=1 Tax=Carnegiea gigantea TaxID=171969 RepID=A0A9Q1JVR3_9CARY|nr:hypothetical protein Cgig2_000007 [Carnegiea gigantea]